MAAVTLEVAGSSRRASARGARWWVRHGAALGYICAALVVSAGWLLRERLPSAEHGLGYWLGIAGASLMGFLLLYPLRKRFRALSVLGKTKYWFRMHMTFGVLGPILILYHCRFELGSLNSRVALFCTLLVAGSGLVGRYLYAKIHFGLYGSKASLEELRARAGLNGRERDSALAFVPDLLSSIASIDRLVLKPPETLAGSVLLPLHLAFKTRAARFRLCRQACKRIRAEASKSAPIAQQRARLERATRAFVKEHLRRVRRVAEFNFYERLFGLWHLFHLPFFYMLVLTAVVHVVAVHMY
jgi:hypothetical protein